MTSDSTVAGKTANRPLIATVADALLNGALPGEIAGFGEEERQSAAEFIAACAEKRRPGEAIVRVESSGGSVGQRSMRIGIVNDDMPFLVDSVAGALAAKGLTIHRLLHPVVCTTRKTDGHLNLLDPLCETPAPRESIMYLETERCDARGRRELAAELEAVLVDVRAAVDDWKALCMVLNADADALGDEEGAALLRWFADRNMTLLGHRIEGRDGTAREPLGMLRAPHPPIWSDRAREAAFAWFDAGNKGPLIVKSDLVSPVHRRVPLDLVVLPVGVAGSVAALSVHLGLWTSAAQKAPPEDVPLLRGRLAQMERELGFDRNGHAGKALRHAIFSLPRDLLVSLAAKDVKSLSLMAMSLADRPRPTLMLLPGVLGRHLFAFVWLPRDELTTDRRLTIAAMLGEAAKSEISNWSVELGEGDLALIRYTLDLEPGTAIPDVEALDRRLVTMVRGWDPGVEEALGQIVGPARATRLALSYMGHFPDSYRSRTEAGDAAQDVLRLAELEDDSDRAARLYRIASDGEARLRLKTYRLGGVIPLSEAVPVFENFGFRVLEEEPSALDEGRLGYIHDFVLEMQGGGDAEAVLERAALVETAIATVLRGQAENDCFNQLLVGAGLQPRDIILFRAWFRYLRQIGLSYSMVTVVEALRRSPEITRGLIALFDARHDPSARNRRDEAVKAAEEEVSAGLARVAGIDEDRILRLIRSVIAATLRTNVYAPAGAEALAFKLDSSLVPGLPAPVPWREIWVYSPRVEGIHLRGGPVARGGLRWSDRRDDFRTEILGLMKAQVVKNAVIVPTGAKGGFYPKQLPLASNREAWLAEGTESYRIFIRALLSVTDNIAEGDVVHPEQVIVHDGNDPYFVVAADKGTASFSDIANEIAVSRGFWLGDAFASGGSHGYDHKAMGITARGAWVSVRRHFAEMGTDIQSEPVLVAGCGDMSGDVFGNGMLLSKTLKLVAAFDHRHIFIDPDPDPAASWAERKRLFDLPRSSWDDYDKSLISKGGGVFPRTQKSIALTAEMKTALGVDFDEAAPAALISAILKAPVGLLWFGGIGTYIKSADENHIEVGDPGNDTLRVDASAVRAKAIGEGANLAITQAGRIEFAEAGGRINTDFIDNSAGVDCSDNEVNIKIPLNAEMAEGRLSFEERNALLARMTDAVAEIVLEDNRLQTLALSIAERGGAAALPSMVRAIEILEEGGTLNRAVEGLASNEDLLRRAQEERGLTRPELAVLLSTSKMALQHAIEAGRLAEDPSLAGELCGAFPELMLEQHKDAIEHHRLRGEIIATKVANRLVNRLGILAPFALTEEEGASWGQAAGAFVAAERLFGMDALWNDIDAATAPEAVRLELFDQASAGLRVHIADIVRSTSPDMPPGEIVAMLRPGLDKLNASTNELLRAEARGQAEGMRERLVGLGAPPAIVDRIVRLFELNGAIGIAALGQRRELDEIALTEAYTKLGEALGLDWAQNAANRFTARDQWERLLAAGLARDFEQLRLDFLERKRGDPQASVDKWVMAQAPRIAQFRRLVDRARTTSVTTAPMLAQIATQARVLLAR